MIGWADLPLMPLIQRPFRKVAESFCTTGRRLPRLPTASATGGP